MFNLHISSFLTTGFLIFSGINHVGRARQTSHLPTIPEEHSATTSLNEGKQIVPTTVSIPSDRLKLQK